MFFRFFAIYLALFFTAHLSAQGSLIGKVVDQDNVPLVGANLVVTGTDLGAQTLNDGSFRIDKIPGGEQQLEISYIGFKTEVRTVNIVSGEETYLDLTLSEETFAIKELVVRATRASLNTPVSYVDLEKEEIQKANLGQDVPFLLRWTPSAVVTSDAGTGIGYTGIRIRGTDPTRINVTLNGIPLNDSESQGVFWVNLPDFLSSTESIQIQRGVGTSTNGAGAFGATINLNTVQSNEEAYATIGSSIGSFDTRKANLRVGTGLLNDHFILEGRLSTIQSDGFIDRASADLNSYAATATYLNDNSSLTFNLFAGHEITYQAWYGVPANLLDDPETRTFNPSGTEKSGEPYDNEVDNYRQTHYQLLYNNVINPNWAFTFNLHYTRGLGFFEQYKAAQNVGDYNFEPVMVGSEEVSTTDLIRRLWLDNHFYGTTYSITNKAKNNRYDLTLGGGFNIYEGLHYGDVIWAQFLSLDGIEGRYYENDARKTDFNIFGKLNYRLTEALNAFVDLQFRNIDYSFLGFNRLLQNVDQSVQLNFFNPKVGLVYAPKPHYSIFASFAVGQREPNRNDFVNSTPDSRPLHEELYDTELGIRWSSSNIAFEANAYYMDYVNQLAPNGEVNDVGQLTRINIPNSHRLGIELQAQWQANEVLMIGGNATLSENKIDGFTEFVDAFDDTFSPIGQEAIVYENTDLAFSPDLIAGLQLGINVLPNNTTHNINLEVLTKYVGDQFIDNSSDPNNIIEAYSFTDLRLLYNLKPKWMKQIDVTFMVRNVFDQQFETNAWSYRYVFDGAPTLDQGFFPQAGRNYLLGLNLSF
ncbi:MAG: TonB-dependent receptor [Bacteroidota bacterium]